MKWLVWREYVLYVEVRHVTEIRLIKYLISSVNTNTWLTTIIYQTEQKITKNESTTTLREIVSSICAVWTSPALGPRTVSHYSCCQYLCSADPLVGGAQTKEARRQGRGHRKKRHARLPPEFGRWPPSVSGSTESVRVEGRSLRASLRFPSCCEERCSQLGVTAVWIETSHFEVSSLQYYR